VCLEVSGLRADISFLLYQAYFANVQGRLVENNQLTARGNAYKNA
jgi:hypothetical protein